MSRSTDILTRVFGADPNPAGTLPMLPYQGWGLWRADCAHDWSTGMRNGVPYWECVGCRVVRSSEPPEAS